MQSSENIVELDLFAGEQAKIGVVVHLYYFPEFIKIIERLSNINEPFDFIVTTPHGHLGLACLASLMPKKCRSVKILHSNNQGRDMLPFLKLINAGLLTGYTKVLKLHTKRSPWVSGSAFPIKASNGSEWFLNSLESLLGNVSIVEDIQEKLDSQKSVMVAPYGSILGIDEWMGLNGIFFNEIVSLADPFWATNRRKNFSAGSMYWLNNELIALVKSLSLKNFGNLVEPIATDGTFIHALERAIGYLASKEECGIAESIFYRSANTL